MLRLVLLVLVEVVVGLAVAALVLAVALPMMISRGVIVAGDLAGSFVIISVMAVAVNVMLFRPGSALTRYFMRDE